MFLLTFCISSMHVCKTMALWENPKGQVKTFHSKKIFPIGNYVALISILLSFYQFCCHSCYCTLLGAWIYTQTKKECASFKYVKSLNSLFFQSLCKTFWVTKIDVELKCIAHTDILVNHEPKISNFVALLWKQNKLYTWKSLRPICNL